MLKHFLCLSIRAMMQLFFMTSSPSKNFIQRLKVDSYMDQKIHLGQVGLMPNMRIEIQLQHHLNLMRGRTAGETPLQINTVHSKPIYCVEFNSTLGSAELPLISLQDTGSSWIVTNEEFISRYGKPWELTYT